MKFWTKNNSSLLVFAGVWVIGLTVGCGQEKRDPQLQYGDPIPARITFSDMPWYDFGSRAVATQTDKTVTITNTGTMPAEQLRGSFYLSMHFSFKGGKYPGTGGSCSETLAA